MNAPSTPPETTGSARPRNTQPDPTSEPAPTSLWRERAPDGRPQLVIAALVAGGLAGLVLPFRDHGVGTLLVLLAVVAPVIAAVRDRPSRFRLASALLTFGLLAQTALRDADWIVALAVLTSVALTTAALVEARSVAGMLSGWLLAPFATLRGLPWLGRSLRRVGGPDTVVPALRTTALSLLAVVVFGALFASADAVFAHWAEAVVPDFRLDTLLMRVVVSGFVATVALAAAYLGLNPPTTDGLTGTSRGTPVRPFEWLVPVGLVLGLFVAFLAAQAAALFGGHRYVRATTGLTYAEHVHSGFGQMTVATLLTLVVVAVAARVAPREQVRDRLVLRVVLGALCAANLLVVTSALHAMQAYTDVFGATRLRLLVAVFEGWVGVVVLLVMVAGLRIEGRWVPRAALLLGATAMLLLSLANPDALIAERNIEVYAEAGRLDIPYLASLSDDAVPTLRGLPDDLRQCLLAPAERADDWLEWNLGRHRAGDKSTSDRARYEEC